MKTELDIYEDKYFYPIMEGVKTHLICVNIIPFNTNKKGFSDITVSFPHKLICGNLYVMVVYDFDSNAILSEPIKTGKQKPSVMHLPKWKRY